MNKLRQRNVALVTTEFVLLEVANALCASAWRGKAVRLIDGLLSLPNLRIIPADTALLADGWELYRARLDKEWSLTDCVSIVVMQKENLDQVFSSDHHFEQAGFSKLL
jgi:predicted nucleic acid-binding protein